MQPQPTNNTSKTTENTQTDDTKTNKIEYKNAKKNQPQTQNIPNTKEQDENKSLKEKPKLLNFLRCQ